MGHKASSLILTGSLIAISILSINFLLILPTAAQVSPPAYTNVATSNVVTSPPGDLLNFEISAEAAIPEEADAYITNTLAFGYAWFDSISYPTNGVVATLHPSMTDTSEYPNLWHTHDINVDLDGCVTSLQELPASHSIRGNVFSIYVGGSTVSVSPSTFQLGSSFELITDTASCPAPLSGLMLVK